MGLGHRAGQGSRRVNQGLGVELLQPPSAGAGDGPGLAIGTQRQHLGADQLDLFAAAFQLRANPEVALGRHRAQQVDDDPAEPGVVALSAPLQRAHQQRRHRRGVLDRRRPGASHQIGRGEFLALLALSARGAGVIDQLVVGVGHSSPSSSGVSGQAGAGSGNRHGVQPGEPGAESGAVGYASVLDSRNSVRRSGPPSVQAMATRSPMSMRSVTAPPAVIRSNW